MQALSLNNRSALSPYNVSEILILFSYGIWLIAQILIRSLYAQYVDPVLIPIRFICIAAALIGELAKKNTGRHSPLALLLLLLAVISVLYSHINTMIDVLVFIYCARDIRFRVVAKESIYITSIVCLFIIISAYLGIIENYVMETSTRTRAYMGFRYALYPSQFAFVITCLAVYLSNNKIRIPYIILLVAVNYIIYFETDSRLSFMLSIFVLVLSVALRVWSSKEKGRKALGVVFISSFAICALVSIIVTVAYDSSNSFLLWLDQDRLLGSRLRLGNEALTEYGITLFGQQVDLVGNALNYNGEYVRAGTYNYIDVLFVQLLVRFGIVGAALFCGTMTAVTWKAWAARNYGLVAVLFVIAIHCVIDDMALLLYFDPFLFLIGGLASNIKRYYNEDELSPS